MISYSKVCEILTDAVPMTQTFDHRLQLYHQMTYQRRALVTVAESRKNFKIMINGLTIVDVTYSLNSSAAVIVKRTTLQEMKC